MYSGRPPKHSLQNASYVQLGVSQPICVVAVTVMCKRGDRRPVRPFVPSANNFQSEHTHRMLLSDVAVTTGQHQGKYKGLIWAKSFILNVYNSSCY